MSTDAVFGDVQDTAIVTTAVDSSAIAAAGANVPVPNRIGRFLVLRRIGTGGMGVVYSAYDEDLDRRVAVKLLHGGARGDTGGRARLQREAQALARLSHPNVVQVYEVGSVDTDVFIAMELVRGATLREWVRDRSPRLTELVDVMRQACAGLAAAHAAGLVHRDFKPDNVLLGDDGRVRVVDFGVARIGGHGNDPGAEPRAMISGDGLSTLTDAGVIVGTPSYMAPEIWAGKPADARSDQFAFCVTLHELMYGARPFVAADREALERAIVAGLVVPPPATSAVPPWLRRIVVRGLAVDPAERWPDMRALGEALARDLSRGRVRTLAISGGAAAMISIGYLAGNHGEAVDRCAEAAAATNDVWSPARREEVGATLAAVQRPWAATTAAKVTTAIDAYAARMAEIGVDVCRATWDRHEQTEALLDRQNLCLGAARRDLAALVDVLAAADARALERASTAAADLPALDRCEDREALLSRVEPPADANTATAVEAIRERNAAARARHRAGRSPEARTIAEAALADTESIDYPPVRAEVLQTLGTTLQNLGEHEHAIERFEQAWSIALGAGHDEVALDAATSLTYVQGDILSRFAEGMRWGRDAEAMLIRSRAQGRRAAWVAANVGSVLYRKGDADGARQRYAHAVEIAEQLDPPEPEALASFVNNLGNCDMLDGAYGSARAHYERSIALREQAQGDAHPSLLSPLNNLASVIRVSGDRPGALVVMQRAVAIADGDGIDPIRRAHTHMNLSSALSELGRRRESLAEGELALDLYRQHGERSHPNVGVAIANTASDLGALGQLERACDRYREGLGILEEALGAAHPTVGAIRGGLGGCLGQLGRDREALVELEGALSRWNESSSTDFQLGVVLRNLGETQLRLGDADAAVKAFERALAVHSSPDAPADERGLSTFAVARALAAARRDPSRAIALAEAAREVLRTAGGDPAANARELARIDAFLAVRALR